MFTRNNLGDHCSKFSTSVPLDTVVELIEGAVDPVLAAVRIRFECRRENVRRIIVIQNPSAE